MKYELPPFYLWTIGFLLTCWLPARAQVVIGSTGAAKENFNAMGSGTALPAHWKMSAAGGGATANWSTGTNVTTLTGAAHSGSPATGGRYNWGTAEGTDRAAGFMSDGTYGSPNAILVRYQNKTGAAVSSFTVTFQLERYRINPSPFSLAFFTSGNDVTYTARSEGAISSAVFAGGAGAYSFTTPQTVYKTVTIPENIPVDGSIYLKWVFTGTGNASQGLGLDNVTLSLNTATPAVSATLADALTTDVNNNGKANEGDKLTYTTTISSTGKDATNVQYNAPLDANTTLSGAVRTSAIAIEDHFATPINTPLTGANVSLNDFGLPAKTVVSFGTTEVAGAHPAGSAGTTDNGGTLTVNANGSFTYTPPAGFTGYDRFSYALQAGVAPNDAGTVTIAVGSAPSAGEGESFPGVIGNVIVNNAPSLLSNDAGDGLKVCAVNNNPALVGAATTASSGGGDLTINDDGTFTYNPAPGYTGPVQFTYTIDNGFSAPQTVAVNLTVSGMLWFVNNTAAAGGDGRLSAPFSSLAGVSNGSGGSGDNQTIFVYSGSGNYTGGIILKNGQRLIGQGATATLASLAGVTVPAYSPALPGTGGSNPVIENAAGNGVTLGPGNTLQGFNLGNASATALSGVNFGTLTISEVGINTTGGAIGLTTGTLVGSFTGITSSGGTNNVNFDAVHSSSVINLGSGAMSGATGSAFNVQRGSVSLTYAGNITHSSTALNAAAVDVRTSHTGSITLSGTLNATGYAGLQFVRADGNYNINGTTSASGNLSNGMLIQNSTGTFHFSSGTSVSNSGVYGIVLLGGSPNVTYSGAVTRNIGDGPLLGFTNVTGGTVTFQTGTLGDSSGSGIILDNADGTVNFNGTTTLNGGNAHLEIIAGSDAANGSQGTVTFASTSSIINPNNGVLIKVNGSKATLAFPGTLTRTGTAPTHAIDVQSNKGGTITLSGAAKSLTSSAAAVTGSTEVVYFNGNTGNTTLAFTGGGLNITSNANGGLVASNAAIANATLKVQGAGNLISSTTGTALSITQTAIGTPAAGEGGLNFRSISVNGAPNGIVLNNTGSGGGLSVTGDGVTASSGGTIQNTVGQGGSTPFYLTPGTGKGALEFSNTANFSLKCMRIFAPKGNGFQFFDIKGNNTIDKCLVDYNHTVVSNAFALRWESSGLSADVTLTLDGTTFQNKGDGATAVSLSAYGVATNSAKVLFKIKDSNTGDAFESKYTKLFGSGIVIGAGDAGGSTTSVSAEVSDTKFVNAWPVDGSGNPTTGGLNDLEFGVAANAVLDLQVINNTFDDIGRPLAQVGVINVNSNDNGRLGSPGNPARIAGNVIQNIGSKNASFTGGYLGMRFALQSTTSINHRLVIANNQVLNLVNSAMLLSSRNNAIANVSIDNSTGAGNPGGSGNTFGTVALPVGQNNRPAINADASDFTTMNLLMQHNSLVALGSGSANSVVSLTSGIANNTQNPTATFNATVVNNAIRNTNALAGNSGRFRARTLAPASPNMNTSKFCIDLRNNALEDASKVFELFHNSNGIFNRSATGNTGTITTSGSIGSVASCTTPAF